MSTNQKFHIPKHNIMSSITYFVIRKIVSPIIRIIWIKKIVGMENIPKWGPAIIAFNHQSYFDFICFIAVSPTNIHFYTLRIFYSSLYEYGLEP